MPEIKHTFTGGKMNKDLDERLVSSDAYKDAMNIQVSTSEDSEVGTAQNILGNKIVPLLNDNQSLLNNNLFGLENAKVVGCVSDEKNDVLYYLVYSPTHDYVISYPKNNPIPGLPPTPQPVIIDANKNVLKFNRDMFITGINVFDDMLFWTDNINEPKKINIPRCKAGNLITGAAKWTTHTVLVNEGQEVSLSGENVPLQEKHITVIKKAPTNTLSMSVDTGRDVSKVYTGIIRISVSGGINDFVNISASKYDFSGVTTEGNDSIFEIQLSSGINTTGEEITFATTNPTDNFTGWQDDTGNIPLGKQIVFKSYNNDGDAPGLPVTDFALKGEIIGVYSDAIRVRITSIDGFPPIPQDGDVELKYVVDLWEDEERLFEFKFPRFSYRYKFEDGEYSPFGPFTQVAFVPGSFDYHPRKGYNLGMTNRAVSVSLKNIVTTHTPKDVVSIDILFKDEPSPVIYVVDTIRPDDEETPGTSTNTWDRLLNYGSFVIEKETINSVVPSNQLLRPWDNVPKKALAQDITGSRLVYANYVQNYDLIKSEDNKKYVPLFRTAWRIFSNVSEDYSNSAKSIKSLREYQLGVVFTDKYGRETPVISNNSGTIKLDKSNAANANRLKVGISNMEWPKDLTHFKFYIKETSGEYYNMAMDRWYDAEDGNIWIAFPSTDRNKIDIDSFLILKKGSDQDNLVTASARYKVIAIENEAPDFIKTSTVLISSKSHYEDPVGPDLFNFTSDQLPFVGKDEFSISYSAYRSSPASHLEDFDKGTVFIDFGKDGESEISDRYKVTSITHDYKPDATNPVGLSDAKYYLQLEKNLGADINFISDSPTGVAPSKIQDGAKVNIYVSEVENKPKFDGRFFVKIYSDEVFVENIGLSYLEGVDFRVTNSRRLYSMAYHDKHLQLHGYTGASPHLLCEGDQNKVEAIDLDVEFEGYISVDYPDVYNAGGPAGGNDRVSTSKKMAQYGYYAVPEFAAMSMYFKRYQMVDRSSDPALGRSPAYLVKKSSNPDIEYLGQGWSKGDHALHEVGAESGGGYTAGFWWQGSAVAGVKNFEEFNNSSHKHGEDLARETEVWFIDGGPAAAYRGTNNALSWDWLSPSESSGQGYGVDVGFGSPSPAIANPYYTSSGPAGVMDGGYQRNDDPTGASKSYGNQGGIYTASTYWDMRLGFGGIIGTHIASNYLNPASEAWNTDHSFFGIGLADYLTTGDVNDAYKDTYTKDFVKNIYPSKQFRWREDPNRQENIYTLSSNLSSRGVLRHSSNAMAVINQEPGTFGGSTEVTSQFHLWSGNLHPATSMAEMGSQNFSKMHSCKVITPTLEWNPNQYGVIDNGLEVTLPAIASDGNTSAGVTASGDDISEDLIIYVTTILGNNTGGGPATAVVHKGMALWKYVKNGSTSSTEDTVNANLGALITSDEFLVIRDIQEKTDGNGDIYYGLVLGGYEKPLQDNTGHKMANDPAIFGPKIGTDYRFVQVGMNGLSHNSEFNINTMGRAAGSCGAVGAVSYTLEFVEPIEPEEILSENPAIWETEPKDTTELDIYHEATSAIPMEVTEENMQDAFAPGSYVRSYITGFSQHYDMLIEGFYFLPSSIYPKIIFEIGADQLASTDFPAQLPHNVMRICYRPDGLDFKFYIGSGDRCDSDGTLNASGSYWRVTANPKLHHQDFYLPWHNCYSFGNGVESNRVRDNFNLPYFTNGVKVSTTLEHEYEEEHRKYGLIYSGIYNSASGMNNTNQFIAAEKITKDVNPIYGSIQKLHSRDSDLVTLCEDKVLKILSNKDALFNADGNTNLTATENVLGQTVPFSGEYGISKNPESFASQNYRAYFTDKVRGAVLRLSKDGLTPISSIGMKDWFRDNLKLSNLIVGSYDDRNDEYNVKIGAYRNKVTAIIEDQQATTTP